MVTARNRAPAIPRCVQTPFELDDAQSSGVHLCSFQLPWAIAEARVATTVSPQRSLGTGAGVVTSDVCCVVSTNFELESFTFLEVPKHVGFAVAAVALAVTVNGNSKRIAFQE